MNIVCELKQSWSGPTFYIWSKIYAMQPGRIVTVGLHNHVWCIGQTSDTDLVAGSRKERRVLRVGAQRDDVEGWVRCLLERERRLFTMRPYGMLQVRMER